ncbi:hypothetical protein, partial [Actinomadura formosensis]
MDDDRDRDDRERRDGGLVERADRAAAERLEEIWDGLAPAAATAARLAAQAGEPVRDTARDAAAL